MQSLTAEFPEGIECRGDQYKSIFQVMLDLHSSLDGDTQADPLPLEKLQEIFFQRIESKTKSANQEKKKELSRITAELVIILDHELRKLDTDDFETQIARIDYGSQITAEYAHLSERTHRLLKKAQNLSQELAISCEYEVPNTNIETDNSIQATTDPTTPPVVDSGDVTPAATPSSLLAGLRWTMATAYQSCEVLNLNPINAQTESVKGILRKADKGREYADLGQILKTHYYLKNSSTSSGCIEIRKQPLVYDFGGSAKMKSEKLDMFSNYNGGKALGIDCSAFASVGAATAGLLYVKNSKKKPIYSRWSTRDFVDPERSGWSCYSKVKVGPETHLQPGDLAVLSADHMVGVDSLEKDPLGIDSVTDIKQCDNLSSDQFHFTLIQSAATKGSIGINRFVASDYLKEASGLQTLFVAYARAACIAKFTNREFLPSVPSTMSIVRHSGASDCKAQRVPLVHEQCIQACGI